ncbi:MAG: internal scaffolding protein [Microvirus sp.]|nr:MAG: internal scaffolding protein [Microvirus sp.]
MTKMTFYRPHKRVQEHGFILNRATGELAAPPSMTKQEFARECDINNIVKSFSVSGQLNHVSAKALSGQYLDLPDGFDLQQSLEIVAQAESAFMSLPAKVRDRFHNDPANFLTFVHDPDNLDEMRRMGLATTPPRGAEPPAATPPTASTGDLKLDD